MDKTLFLEPLYFGSLYVSIFRCILLSIFVFWAGVCITSWPVLLLYCKQTNTSLAQLNLLLLLFFSTHVVSQDLRAGRSGSILTFRRKYFGGFSAGLREAWGRALCTSGSQLCIYEHPRPFHSETLEELRYERGGDARRKF